MKALGCVAAGLLVAACGALDGSGSSGAQGTGSVSGSANVQDFSFSAGDVVARLDARSSDAKIIIELCETACANAVGARASERSLSLAVHGASADLRSGRVFKVGDDASGLALSPRGDIVATDEAVSGEVVIDSSDLRQGGKTVGTFQLQLASGSSIRGFFEAPIIEVAGPVVVLGAALDHVP